MSGTEKNFVDSCFAYTRETGLTYLNHSTGMSDLNLRDFNPRNKLDYEHWICSITVNLDTAKIYIKSHFNSGTARMIAAAAAQKPEDEISDAFMMDYMKEYLNMVMGYIKSRYQSQDVNVSLPVISKGAPSPLDTGSPSDTYTDFWKITCGDHEIVMGSFVTLTGKAPKAAGEDVDDTEPGAIEFL